MRILDEITRAEVFEEDLRENCLIIALAEIHFLQEEIDRVDDVINL